MARTDHRVYAIHNLSTVGGLWGVHAISAAVLYSGMETALTTPELTIKVAADDISRELRLHLYRLQVEIREAEQRAYDLFLQSLVKGTSHLSLGQEAIAAGCAAAMLPGDLSFCTYRGHAHTIARGVPVEKVRKTKEIAQQPISLETPIGEEEDSHLGEFIEDKSSVSPSDAAISISLQEQTESLLKTLTPREERVIKMRFGLEDGSEHTLEEVGQSFAVTRERIRQIEAKALRKLRHPSRSRNLRSFLEDSI